MAGKKKQDHKEASADAPKSEPEPSRPYKEADQALQPEPDMALINEQLQNQNIALQKAYTAKENELRNNQIQFKQLALSQQHAPAPTPDQSQLDEPIKFTRRTVLDLINEGVQLMKSMGIGSGSQLTAEQIMYMEMGKRMNEKATDKILNSIFNHTELKAMKEKNNEYGVA